ncbi:MAG: Dabb family protein [Bacteroidales bacterium]|nr:Dabb family protein [Bacteroidales bacterium]
MIRHIVLFKIKEFSSNEEKKQALDEVLINFRSLVGEIPQIREYKVKPDIVHGTASFDVIIDSSFDNLDDLKDYQMHPAHQYAVKQNQQWCCQKVIVDYNTEY